jgi:parvulin-like peptidyl-prolyl isomerase
VGNEVILAGDVLAQVAFGMLGQSEEPIPDELRDEVFQQVLGGLIDTKLIYADMVRAVPEEGLAQFRKQMAGNFNEDKEQGLPALMKRAKVKTRDELEKKLQIFGSSLEAQKRLYFEKMAARYWLTQEAKTNEPITHEEMLAYYYDHVADYEHKPRAKWEQVSIRFENHANKQEAYQLIAQAGNKIMQGLPFATVARQHSEGAFANEGGRRDWTDKGSLVSEKLDAVLFALPVGSLSRIIEDDKGFHIIRVVQRQEAYRTPFQETQEKIKETLMNERFRDRVGKYLDRLKKETMVWTVYDEQKESQQNVAETPGTNPRR